jgi:hypothetical protein
MTQHYTVLQRKSALYRRHSWQAACRSGWPEESPRHRGSQRLGALLLVEAERVATFQWRGEAR